MILDRAEDEKPMRILIIGKPGTRKSRMAKLIEAKYRLPIIDQIVTKGTVDEKITKALSGKKETQDGLMNSIKELMEKYRNG